MTPQLPAGKIQFIYIPLNYGTIQQIVDALRYMGISGVSLKVANGYLVLSGLEELIAALRAAGIAVGGWHYIYCGVRFTSSTEYVLTGVTPEMEADTSLAAISRYGLDWFEIDAEREFKVWNQASRAARYMNRLKGSVQVPVGLTSYRFPSLHMTFPWRTFFTTAGGVSYVMPQVYWQPPAPNRGPVAELDRCEIEYRNLWESIGLSPIPEIIPAGREYIGDGYPTPGPTAQEVSAFLDTAKNNGSRGASFWALDFLRLHTGGEERMAAIRSFPWGTPPAPVDGNWVQVTANTVNLRPQPSSETGMPVNGYSSLGNKLRVLEKVTNAKGEIWIRAEVYLAEWLTKPTEPPLL